MNSMKPASYLVTAFGPLRWFTTVGSPPPFDLSLSKGFDKLSPNGCVPIILSLSKDGLSPNGSLRTVKFASGPRADSRQARHGPLARIAPRSN